MLRNLLLALALLACLPGMAQARQLTIGMPCLNDDCRLPMAEGFFREAYRRIGVDVTFVSLPSPLELEFADMGRTDGSMLRTEAVGADHANLIMVPYPLARISFTACSLRDDVRIDRPADLAGYRTGISRGGFTAARICRDAKVEPVLMSSLTSGIRMLEEKRLDVIVEERHTIDWAMAEAGRQLYCSEPLFKGYLYHWLNKRNADLVCRLADAFQAMHAEGVARRVFGESADFTPEQAR